MTYFKQFTTVIAMAVFILTFNSGHAQKAPTSEGYSLDIPTTLKLSAAEATNYELITVSHYDTKQKGYVYISGIIDSNGKTKLHSIFTPKKPIQSRGTSGCTGGNYNACAISCTERPTTVGVILCTSYCIIDCIVFED